MELVADQCNEADDATAHVKPLGQLFTIEINQKPQVLVKAPLRVMYGKYSTRGGVE